jgi:hypothetical protein
MFTEARRPSGDLVDEVSIASPFSTSQELKGKTNGSDATDLYDKHGESEIRKDESVFRVILFGGKKSFLLLLLLINTATRYVVTQADTISSSIRLVHSRKKEQRHGHLSCFRCLWEFPYAQTTLSMYCSKALIALVAPFFPGEAERRYGADSTMVGVIIAAYPLAMMLSAPLWSYLTPYAGRMYIYCAGVLTLALGVLRYTYAAGIRQARACLVSSSSLSTMFWKEPSPQLFTGFRDERISRNLNRLAYVSSDSLQI